MPKERNWFYEGKAFYREITPEQRAFIKVWVETVKGGIPVEIREDSAAKSGRTKEAWHVNKRPFFIYTEPVRESPGTERIQLVCGAHHARELKAANLLEQNIK